MTFEDPCRQPDILGKDSIINQTARSKNIYFLTPSNVTTLFLWRFILNCFLHRPFPMNKDIRINFKKIHLNILYLFWIFRNLYCSGFLILTRQLWGHSQKYSLCGSNLAYKNWATLYLFINEFKQSFKAYAAILQLELLLETRLLTLPSVWEL